MNEKIQELIATAATSAEKVGMDLYGFALEQSPLLVEEVIRWGIVKNSILALVNVAIVVGMVIIATQTNNNTKKNNHGDNFITVMKKLNSNCDINGLFMGIGCVIFSVLFIAFSYDAYNSFQTALQAFIAPRLYFLEVVSELM